MATNIITLGGNSILDAIIVDKTTELGRAKRALPFGELRHKLQANLGDSRRDFYGALSKSGSVALIAEIKKASPSAGDINTQVNITEQATQYEAAGARALSILTDAHFKGELSFLQQVKQVTTLPILRKDFIFDEYQIYESAYFGADALLLIAEIVTEESLRELINLTHELGLECLVEAHTQLDLEKALAAGATVVGVNGRDLRTFEVDLRNIELLAPLIPKNKIFVAESGIESRSDVERVVAAGANAILVGTALMQAPNVALKIKELRLL